MDEIRNNNLAPDNKNKIEIIELDDPKNIKVIINSNSKLYGAYFG